MTTGRTVLASAKGLPSPHKTLRVLFRCSEVLAATVGSALLLLFLAVVCLPVLPSPARELVTDSLLKWLAGLPRPPELVAPLVLGYLGLLFLDVRPYANDPFSYPPLGTAFALLYTAVLLVALLLGWRKVAGAPIGRTGRVWYVLSAVLIAGDSLHRWAILLTGPLQSFYQLAEPPAWAVLFWVFRSLPAFLIGCLWAWAVGRRGCSSALSARTMRQAIG